MSGMKEAIAEMQKEIESMQAYIISKTKTRDFHAVSDAANDCREIQAKIEILQSMSALDTAKRTVPEYKWPGFGDIFAGLKD